MGRPSGCLGGLSAPRPLSVLALVTSSLLLTSVLVYISFPNIYSQSHNEASQLTAMDCIAGNNV